MHDARALPRAVSHPLQLGTVAVSRGPLLLSTGVPFVLVNRVAATIAGAQSDRRPARASGNLDVVQR
jgi:hypothetical protein